MRRNINLQDLSKDHHQGLLLGWKIKQGLKQQVPTAIIKSYIEYFFKEALLPHFKEEEVILLSCLADENELKQKTLEDHRLIEKLVEKICREEKEDEMYFLADTLDAHIRFEERTLFPYLEDRLSVSVLEDIGNQIRNQDYSFTDNYPYEFWKLSN